MGIFKTKLKGVYFQVPKSLKKKLDIYLTKSELKLGEYFNELIERELQYEKDRNEWAKNNEDIR